jgi:hypothetical protein
MYFTRAESPKQKGNEMNKLNTKGDFVGTTISGNIVSLWFASPTGDSSDSQIFELVCRDNEQAEFIAKRHREVWGLDY